MVTFDVDEFWRIHSDSTVWEKVLHLGQRKEFKSGDIIVNAGELVTGLYYLASGIVNMKRTSWDGAEKIIMYVEQNSLFSETPFFIKRPIRSSFTCYDDAVVYFFPHETVDEMIVVYPEIAKDIIRALSEKLSVVSNQSASLGLDTIDQRIIKFILLRYNSMSLRENEVISLGALRMKDIASILGVHRATLYKSLKELERNGLIELLSKNKLKLLDVEKLSTLAYE
ncbi:MAG: Crp/Fnr family transcriptional regulator [Desulfovibrionales bacterium]|nr:Crp/Fnr family transcriptional regulator [Desulfovibrionales bacterium]